MTVATPGTAGTLKAAAAAVATAAASIAAAAVAAAAVPARRPFQHSLDSRPIDAVLCIESILPWDHLSLSS